MMCVWHLCNIVLTGRKKRFCSDKCKNKFFVDRRRKKIKEMSVEYLGGKCLKCGYKKCIKALEFHHIEPEHKDFNLSKWGHTRSWERVKAELDKCILVCANCHREIHYNMPIPSQALLKEGVETRRATS